MIVELAGSHLVSCMWVENHGSRSFRKRLLFISELTKKQEREEQCLPSIFFLISSL